MSRFWFTGAQRKGTDDGSFLAQFFSPGPIAGRRRSRKRRRRAAALPHTRVRRSRSAMHAQCRSGGRYGSHC